MKKINLDIYQLFLKYGSECLWAIDSRVSRPRETSIETDKMFDFIEAVDHRFEMISTGFYCEKMVATYRKEIKELRPLFSEDVFQTLEKKYLQ